MTEERAPADPEVAGARSDDGWPAVSVREPEDDPGRRKPPWYRRRAVLVGGAVAVVVALAVVSDLPHHVSRRTEIASDTAVMKEVNGDVGGCSYALKEALAIRRAQLDHSLSASDTAEIPGLLRDDQAACSFTDNSIFDLSNIEVPGAAGGKHLNSMIGTVITWASSDALAAIEDIQTLSDDPTDTLAEQRLDHYEALLTSDRAAADSQLADAERVVSARLPALALTSVPTLVPG